MYDWIFSILVRWLPYRIIEHYYLKTGKDFGDAASYLVVMGPCIGFKKIMRRWGRWEREYSRRGYRTIPLDEFVDMGGYGGHVHKEDLEVNRREGEKPILHAS